MRLFLFIAGRLRWLWRPKYLVHAARIVPPEVVEVVWVTTIALPAAPTAAELNAGVDITGFLRGVPSIPETGNTADISDLSSKFNKRQAATHGGDVLTLEAYRDDTADTAYTTLLRTTQGFLVVAWDGLAAAGTFAVADLVWIYPSTIISRGLGTPGRDEAEFFISEQAITDDPTEAFPIAL